jgi:SH3-like domain-containing protein
VPDGSDDTGRTAKVTKHVNLRSRPEDKSKVLTVVPARASVNVLSCKSWCEVEYDGQKGFIYKRFIGKS